MVIVNLKIVTLVTPIHVTFLETIAISTFFKIVFSNKSGLHSVF